MIRSFKRADLPVLIPLIQEDKHMQPDEISERLTDNTTWVYGDGVLQGCAAVTGVRATASGRQQISCWLYVGPAFRQRGIGSALWTVVAEHLRRRDADLICTGYRSDRGGAPAFFAARGFHPWFSSHLLSYTGPGFPRADLQALPYTDELFEHCIRLLNEGFRELRETNVIHPTLPYPPGYDQAAARQEFQEAAQNNWLFAVDGQIVGLAQVGPDYIDNLVVAADQQRKGYGRQITQFCINLLRERGAEVVKLGVLDSNRGARALYDSLGFSFIETHTFARLDHSQLRR